MVVGFDGKSIHLGCIDYRHYNRQQNWYTKFVGPKTNMPLGAHLPTSKGFEGALRFARDLDCDCLQFFCKSPRQWSAPPLNAEVAASFRSAWKSSGLKPLVAHDSYLINLAAPDDIVLAKSIEAMIDEVERCEALGCDYLVTHCGSHLGKGDSASEAAGVERLADALRIVLYRTPEAKVRIALENTAGQGTCLGGSFDHIGQVLRDVGSDRLAACLDTCHAFAAGHDIVTQDGLEAVLAQFDGVIGLDKLAVIHLNDSKGEFGRHLDRHEHIGAGRIGREAMARIVCHRHLRDLPFILETPEVETMVGVNLATVRELRQLN